MVAAEEGWSGATLLVPCPLHHPCLNTRGQLVSKETVEAEAGGMYIQCQEIGVRWGWGYDILELDLIPHSFANPVAGGPPWNPTKDSPECPALLGT